MDISLILSIISILVVVTNFILSILDRGKKAGKENHQELIQYQIDEIKTDLKEIKDLLKKYDKEIDGRIDEKLEYHVKLYHKGVSV